MKYNFPEGLDLFFIIFFSSAICYIILAMSYTGSVVERGVQFPVSLTCCRRRKNLLISLQTSFSLLFEFEVYCAFVVFPAAVILMSGALAIVYLGRHCYNIVMSLVHPAFFVNSQ